MLNVMNWFDWRTIKNGFLLSPTKAIGNKSKTLEIYVTVINGVEAGLRNRIRFEPANMLGKFLKMQPDAAFKGIEI